MVGAWLAQRGVRATYARLNRRDLDGFLNRDGVANPNRGITAIALRGGLVSAAKDFLFDTGPAFRRVWGEEPAP